MTEIFVKDTIDEILKGFSKHDLIPCPTCRTIIDCAGQDIESNSKVYLCYNCGFKIKKTKE